MDPLVSWIDLHTHLNMLDEGVEAAIAFAQSQGVKRMVTIGTEETDHQIVLDIARKYYPVVSCTLGVHPHSGAEWNQSICDFIRKEAQAKEVVAVGEIGLDYYYKNSDPNAQKIAFREQMDLAAELGLPVEIHTRDAESDTVDILQEYRGKVRGILHCFTGTQWLAEKALDLGYNLSFSGIVTFKSADALRQTCQYVPLQRLHIETDAPFLAPVPQRGKKNTSGYLIHTAQFVAQLKQCELAELARQTQENAKEIFPKIVLDE